MPKEILIVDDEPGAVVPIQFLMEQQGDLVIIAERGEDALDPIYHYKPDLVILDIMLPAIVFGTSTVSKAVTLNITIDHTDIFGYLDVRLYYICIEVNS